MELMPEQSISPERFEMMFDSIIPYAIGISILIILILVAVAVIIAIKISKKRK